MNPKDDEKDEFLENEKEENQEPSFDDEYLEKNEEKKVEHKSTIQKIKDDLLEARKKHLKSMEKLYGMELEDIDFISDSKKALLIDTPKKANVFLYVALALIFVFLIWASFSKIEQNTSGQGKVIPSKQVQVIQNLDGGIVSEIYVQEGDVVKKGQPLLKLDDTRFKAVYNEDYAKYLTLLATIARYQAEIAEANDINFPDIVRKDAPELVQSETEIFKSRKQSLDSTIAILQKSYELSQKELNITRPLVKEQVMSELELLRAERQSNDLQGSITEEKEKYKDDAYKNLKNMLADLAILEKGIEGSKDRLQRTLLVSPVDGIVKNIEVSTLGQVIEPGKNIMEIVPLKDKLQVEVQISPRDIGFIKPGDEATVKITAYDYAIYGSLIGKVDYISADTLQSDENGHEKSYYRVTVTTNKNYLIDQRNQNKKLPIYPGMQATVTIATDKITVLQYLIGPVYKTSHEALRESQRL